MNSKSTKRKRKDISRGTLADVDQRDGLERFDDLMEPLDKYLASEERKAVKVNDSS
ncbi:hypothetical protein [Mesorhizobium sp. M0030]|uniref:hypothetical protein n=1 Tax=Mesorhizobium sp. M0030 TaxID=2956851 RepID=UPI003338D8A8